MEGRDGGSARPATSRSQPGFLEYESSLSFLVIFLVFFLWFSFSFTKDSSVKISLGTNTAFENMMEVTDTASFM